MTNKILDKPCNRNDYAEFAIYCNNNNLMIVDKDDYYEAVKIIPTLEELKQQKVMELKQVRNEYKKENNYDNDKIVLNLLTGLGVYTQEERDACRVFFDDMIIKYDNFKEQIYNAKTKTALNNINITFEAENE